MQIKKREALNILSKLNMPLKGKKERIATFHYNNVFILSTAVPKGTGDMIEYCQCKDKPVRLISHCRNCGKKIEYPLCS
jgi:hypothetical protein